MFSTLLLLFLFAVLSTSSSSSSDSQWTSSHFPDLRGPSVNQCVAILPRNRQHTYVCDPDRILNNSQAATLNRQLHELAIGTPCHCQRRSQCSTGIAGTLSEGFHGFVVSVAIVKNLQMQMHSPSEAQLTERAEAFCKALEGRWALGDCGNSAIVFVWEHYKKMVIWPARLAEKYITGEERRQILASVNDLVQTDRWAEALTKVVGDLRKELNGEPQDRVDTGTLALVTAVGVAVLLTCLITCCVCAFRCCGNLRGEDRPRGVQRAVQRVDSLKASVMRRGSQLRRSFSRSPKFGNPQNRFFADTSILMTHIGIHLRTRFTGVKMYDRMTSNGNGNKANMRICMLENLLKATEAAGTSARVNSLKQVIRRNKMDMAPDAGQSLDLMREIFQNEISREIQQILDRHIRTTFSPAIENLRRNGHEVDEQVINMLFVNILEAAKGPYTLEKENNEIQQQQHQHQQQYTQQQYIPEQREQVVTIMTHPPKRDDDRVQMDLSPLSQHDIARWNPDRFGLTTMFVSATKVSQVCGQPVSAFFNANPRIFRYACDESDRRLLADEARVHDSDGSRVYLVCLDDIRELAATTQELEMSSFCVKETLILKIRRYAQPFFERLLHRHKQQQMQQWPYAENN